MRYRLKLKLSEPVGEPVGGASTESTTDGRSDPGTGTGTGTGTDAGTGTGTGTDAGTGTDPGTGTGTGTDLAEVWTAALDVEAADGAAGYSLWARLGSLSPDRFDVDGTTYQVMVFAEIAGGLYLGLRASLDTEFVLEIDGQQFTASESQVPNGLVLRGTYWWPTDGVLSSSAGSTLDVSLSAATDALPERSEAPPGAWFSSDPQNAHDGSSQFTLRLNFDEADPQVTDGSMADALTVTGGSLVTASEALDQPERPGSSPWRPTDPATSP